MYELEQPDSVFVDRELAREQAFSKVWTAELNDVFADVAKYYDCANRVASLGLWDYFQSSFVSTFDLKPGYRVLDVCAGTNAVGIALLKECPGLEVHGLDRSAEMLKVGSATARQKGLSITNSLGDVHNLPFEDNYFDIVTLQWASRHLRVMKAFDEIKRVLKPGGYFYHCDMLRPHIKTVGILYYGYLKMCLTTTAWIFESNQAALNCRQYFLDALQLFYSTEELADLLSEVGFVDVRHQNLLGGMIGFHKVKKPE
ncbi:MAG: class I SAM-dependent methyltransferase [Arenicellales bacterium]|nr:class I SAM-dependent methyltransferase [Arenicellales bacterium]